MISGNWYEPAGDDWSVSSTTDGTGALTSGEVDSSQTSRSGEASRSGSVGADSENSSSSASDKREEVSPSEVLTRPSVGSSQGSSVARADASRSPTRAITVTR